MARAADPETPLQPERDEEEQGPAPNVASNGTTTLFMVVIMVWQMAVLGKYSKSFPASIFTGEHRLMNESCANIFWMTNWAVFLALFVLLLDVALTAITVVSSGDGGRCQSHIKEVKCLQLILGAMRFWISVVGISILFKVKTSETSQCQDLYTCAWWCFLGFLLLSVALGCCVLFFMAGVATGARERGSVQGASAAAPAYGVAQRPSAATSVEPFTGQGHRLGAGDPEPADLEAPGGHRLGGLDPAVEQAPGRAADPGGGLAAELRPEPGPVAADTGRRLSAPRASEPGMPALSRMDSGSLSGSRVE